LGAIPLLPSRGVGASAPAGRNASDQQGASMSDVAHNDIVEQDMQTHYQTYRSFVRYSIVFVAHVAVILALMAYFLV
jgi:Bacterial aa3 type cytochrome c oxidase subunit IV